jgi:hypothetical protein
MFIACRKAMLGEENMLENTISAAARPGPTKVQLEVTADRMARRLE